MDPDRPVTPGGTNDGRSRDGRAGRLTVLTDRSDPAIAATDRTLLSQRDRKSHVSNSINRAGSEDQNALGGGPPLDNEAASGGGE